VQHNDLLPGETAGVTFEQALTQKTDISGALNAAGAYGPYLQKIPMNQFNDLNTVRIDGAAAGANTEGWRFGIAAGATEGFFQADDTAAHAAL